MKKLSLTLTIAILALFLYAGGASALTTPINTITDSDYSEMSLNDILEHYYSGYTLERIDDLHDRFSARNRVTQSQQS